MCQKHVRRWSDDRSKIKEENGWFGILCCDLWGNLAKQQEKKKKKKWPHFCNTKMVQPVVTHVDPSFTRLSTSPRQFSFFPGHKQEMMIENINGGGGGTKKKKIKYKGRRVRWKRYQKLLVGKLKTENSKQKDGEKTFQWKLERTEASLIRTACATLLVLVIYQQPISHAASL